MLKAVVIGIICFIVLLMFGPMIISALAPLFIIVAIISFIGMILDAVKENKS